MDIKFQFVEIVLFSIRLARARHRASNHLRIQLEWAIILGTAIGRKEAGGLIVSIAHKRVDV